VSELEALRRENQRLRKNIEILLDRISAQDRELKTAKVRAAHATTTGMRPPDAMQQAMERYKQKAMERYPGLANVIEIAADSSQSLASPDPTQQAEAALKALREARDPVARRRAAQALERATQQIRGQLDPDAKPKQ
jgi:hypothetical protein